MGSGLIEALRHYFFLFCFVVCTTRALPVGIPRDIYSIYLDIHVYMDIYLHNGFFFSPCKMYPAIEEWLRLVTYRLFL
jgi:hypothetical protein